MDGRRDELDQRFGVDLDDVGTCTNRRPTITPTSIDDTSPTRLRAVGSSRRSGRPFPVGLAFRAGEQLRLLVSAQNLFGTMMPGNREYTPRNTGQHVVHTGGSRASYLQLPVKAV
ncbi:MAG TPA: CocE/NonD family hydrolase C-terminal non-catalytic domain-containing protein [Mycobacterium sp.]|nr:CocE/NonD family hydrolase C-terminal non-catalytic domain-containing protein [Mycobacterium sp.]